MRSLKDNLYAVIDLGVVLTIGVAFVGLVLVAFIVWTIRDQLVSTTPGPDTSRAYGMSWNSTRNITGGFDDAVNLLLIAITIFILAIAISALLMLRGR